MMKKKKVIILASLQDQFSIDSLKILLKNNLFDVLAIIVLKKNMRKNKKINFLKNIKFFYEGFPHTNNKIIRFILENNIKTCIAVGYQNRVRSSFIKLFENGIYNIHPAVLPLNKGSHSTFYTIMNNNYIGATLHLMNEKFDSGPIIDQIKQKNNLSYDASYVFTKSREMGLKILKKNLKKIYLGKFKTKKNTKSKVNYKKDIVKASTLIHNKKYSGEYVWRLIRAVNFKNNGFYIKFKKKYFKIIPQVVS